MSSKERLAKWVMFLLRATLRARNVKFTDGVQHGGGTIDCDQIVVGEWGLAVLTNGRVSAYNEEQDQELVFEAHEIDELLKTITPCS